MTLNNVGLDVTTLFLYERYVDQALTQTGLFWYTGLNSLIAVITSIQDHPKEDDTKTELIAFNKYCVNKCHF